MRDGAKHCAIDLHWRMTSGVSLSLLYRDFGKPDLQRKPKFGDNHSAMKQHMREATHSSTRFVFGWSANLYWIWIYFEKNYEWKRGCADDNDWEHAPSKFTIFTVQVACQPVEITATGRLKNIAHLGCRRISAAAGISGIYALKFCSCEVWLPGCWKTEEIPRIHSTQLLPVLGVDSVIEIRGCSVK